MTMDYTGILGVDSLSWSRNEGDHDGDMTDLDATDPESQQYVYLCDELSHAHPYIFHWHTSFTPSTSSPITINLLILAVDQFSIKALQQYQPKQQHQQQQQQQQQQFIATVVAPDQTITTTWDGKKVNATLLYRHPSTSSSSSSSSSLSPRDTIYGISLSPPPVSSLDLHAKTQSPIQTSVHVVKTLFQHINPTRVVVLSSIPRTSLISVGSSTSTSTSTSAPFVFSLSTSRALASNRMPLRSHNTIIPPFPMPNMLSGTAAAVMQHCEVFNIEATAVVAVAGEDDDLDALSDVLKQLMPITHS